MENLLKEYSVKELRLLLTHINKKTKISGIRLMKKNEIINLIKSHYSPNTVISNGEIRFTPLKIDIGDISLKEKMKKEVKKKIKKEVKKKIKKEEKDKQKEKSKKLKDAHSSTTLLQIELNKFREFVKDYKKGKNRFGKELKINDYKNELDDIKEVIKKNKDKVIEIKDIDKSAVSIYNSLVRLSNKMRKEYNKNFPLFPTTQSITPLPPKKEEPKKELKPFEKKLKEKVKERVVKEVVKDTVKELKKRGRPPKIKEVVEIKKEVKKVVEKKKPAPNKKAKEHIKKVEKEVVKDVVKKEVKKKNLTEKIDDELSKLKLPAVMVKELNELTKGLKKPKGRKKK
jgi:hypothetical protein